MCQGGGSKSLHRILSSAATGPNWHSNIDSINKMVSDLLPAGAGDMSKDTTTF